MSDLNKEFIEEITLSNNFFNINIYCLNQQNMTIQINDFISNISPITVNLVNTVPSNYIIPSHLRYKFNNLSNDLIIKLLNGLSLIKQTSNYDYSLLILNPSEETFQQILNLVKLPNLDPTIKCLSDIIMKYTDIELLTFNESLDWFIVTNKAYTKICNYVHFSDKIEQSIFLPKNVSSFNTYVLNKLTKSNYTYPNDILFNDLLIDLYNVYFNETQEEKDKYIIITGGIGDFLALDHMFKFSENNNIIFICKQGKILKKLFEEIPFLQNKYFYIDFDFDNILKKPGFNGKNELYEFIPQIKKYFYNIKVIDIGEYFQIFTKNIDSMISNYNQYYNKIMQSIILPDIKIKFNLPKTYAIICPYTEDNRIWCVNCKHIHEEVKYCDLTRNFSKLDFENTIKFLKNNNIIGVLISLKAIDIKHKNIINLSTKTTLLESIEITKQAKYYIGVDTFLATITTRIIKEKNIIIKCNNNHGINYKKIYWFPYLNLKLFTFITC